MDAYEREENALIDALNSGEIDRATFNREMAQLRRDAREDAQEAAERAYEQTMDQYGYGRY